MAEHSPIRPELDKLSWKISDAQLERARAKREYDEVLNARMPIEIGKELKCNVLDATARLTHLE